MKAGKTTALPFSRFSWEQAGPPGRHGLCAKAQCLGQEPALAEGPKSARKDLLPKITQGLVDSQSSPRFSPKGVLESIELGAEFLSICSSVKTNGWVSDRCRGWETPTPVALPSQTPRFREPWNPRRDHSCTRSRVEGEAGAGRPQRRGHPPPPRAPPCCRFRARRLEPAGPSYSSTKGLRCIAFFGVKPSPGQSEISAFFRSIATQKV